MSLFNPPAHTNRYALARGMSGHDVGALQLALNEVGLNLTADGSFGELTEQGVKQFQSSVDLASDGVAGYNTQRRLALYIWREPQKTHNVANGLIRGLTESESGFFVGAVNWNIAGGVDCGWTQKRVYEAEYSEDAFRDAFDGKVQFTAMASKLRQNKDTFFARVNEHKRAWQLAALSWNWPWGADQLSRGKALSSDYAAWVDVASGGRVKTPADWATYYEAMVCRYVSDWTP